MELSKQAMDGKYFFTTGINKQLPIGNLMHLKNQFNDKQHM